MNKLLLSLAIVLGMNSALALAQHADMPGHQSLPDGGHVMDAKMKAEMEKKKPAKPEKKVPAPMPDGQKQQP